jgi:Sulphur transport
LGVKTKTVVIAYEALCIAIVILASRYAPNAPSRLNPILGGLAIGTAQALSLLICRKTLGVNDVYEHLGAIFFHTKSPSTYAKPSSLSAVWFALGIAMGSKALTALLPQFMPVATEMPHIGRFAALFGGAAMAFGAGLAGGCPSGHGISGMATLSISSLVTVAAMFGGGIGWKFLVG